MHLKVDIELAPEPIALLANFTVEEGITQVIGPNGCGKSTLLRSILGVHKPKRGRIELGEELLFCSESGVDAAVEKRQLGYVPQRNTLFAHLDVRANVAFGSGSDQSANERVGKWLDRFEIGHLASCRSHELSGGEAQRVALARALASQPKALLLDEPTTALDIQARLRLRRLLLEHVQPMGIPVLLVSHAVEDGRALGAEILSIEAQHVLARGSAERLHETHISPFVDAFCRD